MLNKKCLSKMRNNLLQNGEIRGYGMEVRGTKGLCMGTKVHDKFCKGP